MIYYINKKLNDVRYLSFTDKLDDKLFDIGQTWGDYLNNKWIMLSDSQVEFAKEHPEASIEEIWNKELNPELERTLEEAKQEKIIEIDSYDNSNNVNEFVINDILRTWFTVQERLNYKQSIEAAKLMGVEELSFFVGDNLLSVSVQNAEMMLAALQLYADQCFIVTKQHKIAIEKLETIEEIDNYDYKIGYPEKLKFNI